MRSSIRSKRRALDPGWILKASERIQDGVIRLPEFQAARAVGLYQALPFEVQTAKLIRACWGFGKKVCLPAFNQETDRYELTWVTENDRMKPGMLNIREPDSKNRAGFMDLDLLVVPALAYDPHGGRLGHGGGHYDRILGVWSGFKVGIAFEFQIFDEVPMGSQDIPVDLVITELHRYTPEGRLDLESEH